ncbi:MAG: guanylate kinase [Phycisphaeraceae bacterium]|nr:guanylate kinase [Phycisphaeraceae bacterium]MCB9847216.1 guanylate kinase [Phycisphaeraceae bacterium]
MLLVISGPSGVGKTTIRDVILDSVPGSFFSVSATTRPKTDADREGVDYLFLTDERFDAHVEAGDFLEHATFAGNRYGTLRQPVEAALAAGRLALLDVDVVGARNIKSMRPDAYFIFFMPPSKDELLRRLRDRKRESEEAIQKRFAVASREIDDAQSSGIYDEFVVNDDLTTAIARTLEIVERERARRAASG